MTLRKKVFPLNKYIFTALRRIWRWHPIRKEAYRNAQASATGYRCCGCKALFVRKGVAIDHKEPVIDPRTGFVDWNTYIARLFCDASNLQCLCKTCHNAKTREERKLRKKKAA